MQLRNLVNIGARTEASLHEIGIYTPEDLNERGAFNAWVDMQWKHPQKDICTCALFALEGALRGIVWYRLPPELKQELQERVDRWRGNDSPKEVDLE